MSDLIKKVLSQEWFDMKKFFLMGGICFSIIVVMNIISLVNSWSNTYWSGKVSSISSIIFTLMLAVFFLYSYLDTKDKEDEHKRIMEELEKQ